MHFYVVTTSKLKYTSITTETSERKGNSELRGGEEGTTATSTFGACKGRKSGVAEIH